MGKTFLQHPGGARLYSCAKCDTVLTNKSQLISMRFTGATGRAFLFNKVVNITFSEVQDRVMLTGRHMVRDVSCKKCDAKLGWMYEFAVEESQRYKVIRKYGKGLALYGKGLAPFPQTFLTNAENEGRVILERALVSEADGIDEIGVN